MTESPDHFHPHISRRRLLKTAGAGAIVLAAGPLMRSATFAQSIEEAERQEGRRRGDSRNRAWRAGDHHIHSEYSGDFDTSTNPPTFLKGADAVYPIVTNAIMAKFFGLQWVMCTDHGGPTHSKVNLELAYPDLLRSRLLVPDVLQFWGMEFDAPQLDHHTLMIPRHDGEAQQLFELESGYSKRDPFPADPSFDTEQRMLDFLSAASAMNPKPLVIAHHVSRSASGLGVYGQDLPREFRAANNIAPEVYVGFEGSPGHQAGPLVGGDRGAYGNFPTLGGYDQMTARVGGLWDSLLGEGRRWWITATSDSHVHYTRGGSDFWPGEYSKTYVLARQDYADIMDGLRNGRVWVTTGDLISGLELNARGRGGRASMGETLIVRGGSQTSVDIEIRVKPLEGQNFHGDNPQVSRVDLIVGQITGPNPDINADTNPTAQVVARFGPGDWKQQGKELVMRHTLQNVTGKLYARVRGTNTTELEPEQDGAEDPWTDLWFYSNPVFVQVGS